MSSVRTGRWLLREPRPGADARLICFPYAGAGASSFRSWPVQIGDLEVCAVQTPDRANRTREPEPLLELLPMAIKVLRHDVGAPHVVDQHIDPVEPLK